MVLITMCGNLWIRSRPFYRFSCELVCSTISMALATILANLVHQWSCELVDERAHVCQHLQQVVEVGSWAVAVIVSEDGN